MERRLEVFVVRRGRGDEPVINSEHSAWASISESLGRESACLGVRMFGESMFVSRERFQGSIDAAIPRQALYVAQTCLLISAANRRATRECEGLQMIVRQYNSGAHLQRTSVTKHALDPLG